jgi:hypothetical protein
MKKTALTQLIEKLTERKSALANTNGEKFCFDYAIESAKKLLEVECQDIEVAYNLGSQESSLMGKEKTGDEYFNETFKQ